MNQQLSSKPEREVLPLSIMYVEDEVVILRSVTSMLERKIKNVYIATNGKIGLETFIKHKPQIVVTDIKMPVMNGLSMIEKIQEIEPTTKFIVVSAYGETNYFIRAIELGVHGFILKPVDVNQLMEAIQEMGKNLLLQMEIVQKEDERTKAENARLTLEKQYAELHQNMRDGSVRADLDGKIINCNLAFQKILDYTEKELYTKTTRDITPEKWHRIETDIIQSEVLKQGYSHLYEKEYIRKDGTIIPIECRTYLQKDEQGEKIGYWGIVRDISKRKEADEALRKSEEQFRDLFENANDVIWLSDLEGKYLMVNRMFEAFLGYSKEELEGKQSIFTIKKEEREESIKNYRKAVKGEYIEYETNVICKDGSVRMFWLKLRPIYDNGKVVFVQGMGRDITDRKQAEAALEEQKVYFERLFESAPEAIIVADNNGFILQINNAFSELFQYTIDEIKGKHIDELITPEELLQEAEKSTQQLTQGIDISFETKRIAKDGTMIDVSVLGAPIIIDGEQIAVYGIYRDIGDRKRAEDELKESYERLQKLIEDTVNVLANVVELRDPYTAGHQHNVAQLGIAIAKEMGCSEDMLEGIRIGGTMHDIGKIKVPIRILNKSEMLTDKEWEQIKNHPTVGYELLKDLDFPWQVAKMVHQHHERIDGSGYPNGLKKKDILLEARILAVADVVEAMANDRPYRQSLGLDIALEEIIDNKGSLYDPVVVDHAVKILKSGSFVFNTKHT
ncbi:MAG: PAS domain S-box protein [Candidatus Cloacimonetes bacterium]|nr:PAS domain S-box protein [Candidatus Cloacimonadota bacterium]